MWRSIRNNAEVSLTTLVSVLLCLDPKKLKQSATLIFFRTFMECEEVKAVVSIGCCYNLLSEKTTSEDSCSKCGFPMSAGLKSLGFSLGKNARDLACQVFCMLYVCMFFSVIFI